MIRRNKLILLIGLVLLIGFMVYIAINNGMGSDRPAPVSDKATSTEADSSQNKEIKPNLAADFGINKFYKITSIDLSIKPGEELIDYGISGTKLFYAVSKASESDLLNGAKLFMYDIIDKSNKEIFSTNESLSSLCEISAQGDYLFWEIEKGENTKIYKHDLIHAKTEMIYETNFEPLLLESGGKYLTWFEPTADGKLVLRVFNHENRTHVDKENIYMGKTFLRAVINEGYLTYLTQSKDTIALRQQSLNDNTETSLNIPKDILPDVVLGNKDFLVMDNESPKNSIAIVDKSTGNMIRVNLDKEIERIFSISLQKDRVLINSSKDLFIYNIRENSLAKFANPDFDENKVYISCKGNNNKFAFKYGPDIIDTIYIER